MRRPSTSTSSPHPGGVRTLTDLLRHRWSAASGPRYTFLDPRGRPKELPLPRLRGLAIAVAQALAKRGVGPGDRVLLAYPPDCLDFVAGLAGCLLAGAIAVPVQTPAPNRLRADLPRLSHITADCGARVALTTRRYRALTRLARLWAGVQRLRGRPLAQGVPELRWLATDGLRPAPVAADPGHEPDPADVAYLQYTSGSTRRPRGVRITHAGALHNLRLIAEDTEVDASAVLVGWVPLFHDMGLVGGILNVLYGGGHLVFFSPLTFLARPTLWLEAITRYRATHLAAPDFGYSFLMSRSRDQDLAAADLSTVRFALQGGEVARARTVRRLREVLGPAGLRPEAFRNIYGLAESTLFVCGRSEGVARILRLDPDALEIEGRVRLAEPGSPARELVSCGAPPPEMRLAIVNPDSRRRLGADRIGEVWLASPSISPGYWRLHDAGFAARLALEDDSTAWLRTGDLGFLHDGELYLCGRRKELVILGGRNLYPHELEVVVVASHPGLRRGCAVALSVQGEDRERLVVVAEVKDDRTRPEVCREAIAPAIRAALVEHHKVAADAVVFLHRGDVPKTSSGKLQRSLLRSRYLRGELRPICVVGEGPRDAPPPLADPLERVLAELRRLLDQTHIDPDASLAELGLDSIANAELLERLSARCGRTLPADLLLRHDTPRRVAQALSDDLSPPRGLAVDVREAGPEDLPRVEAYLARPEIDGSFNLPLSARPEPIAARVADRAARGLWLLGERDGEIAACLAVVPADHPDALELSTFSVAPDARTSGLGEALYAAALTLARERMGAAALYTDSWAGNAATAGALRAAGFRIVDRYPDPAKRPDGVDTVLYRKDLTGGARAAN